MSESLRSHVQHLIGNFYEMEMFVDPYNKRLRIDDYRGDVLKLIEKAEELVTQFKTEKLIILTRQEHFNHFLQSGFQCEAVVDGFFRGSDAFYFTKYYVVERRNSNHCVEEDRILERVRHLKKTGTNITIPKNYYMRKMEITDSLALSQLYKEVFTIYPTPLHNPDYIKKTMDNGTIYYGFLYGEEIVSCASAEVNSLYYHAELTDCATLPQHRKYGLMKRNLEKLEEVLRQQCIYCVYSIARAQSFGMNAVLHGLGYQYRGRLINNCYIFEKLENMNMWVKDLSKE